MAQRLIHGGPELPESLEYLWDMFIRLSMTRRYTQFGPEALNATLVRDASALFGWDLTPQEAEAIMAVDIVVLNPGKEEAEDNG